MKSLFKHKINFTERFKKRHSLRLHMSLILAATVCSGFLATRTMLALRMENVLLRYPLAVICAYLVFFICVKLWLNYIAPAAPAGKARDHSPDPGDLLPDMPVSGGSDGIGNVGELFSGGGGGFDGGGASESFGDAVTGSGPDAVSSGIDTGGGIGDAVGDLAGDAASALGDEGGVAAMVIFAVLAAMMAVVVGAGVYLVYEAPFILSEAAFDFILAAGLIRGARRMNSADWMGSVFRTTCVPFFVTLLLATLAGFLMRHYFPHATRIAELFSRL